MPQWNAFVGGVVSAETLPRGSWPTARCPRACAAVWGLLLAVGCGSSTPATQTNPTTPVSIPASVSGPLTASLAALAADGGPAALGALAASYALQAGVQATPITLPASAVAPAPGERGGELIAGSGALMFAYQVAFLNAPPTLSSPLSGLLVFQSQTQYAMAYGPATATNVIPPATGYIVQLGAGAWKATAGSESALLQSQTVTCPDLSALPSFIGPCNNATFLGEIDIAASSAYRGSPTGLGQFVYPAGATGTPPTTVQVSGVVMTIDCSQTSLCSPSPIQVSVNPARVTLAPSASQPFIATVTGTGSQTTAVMWTTTCGTITPVSTNSDETTVYTAPPSAVETTCTVTATSTANGTSFTDATVTVIPAGTITVAVTPMTATVVPTGMQQMMVMVSGTTGSQSTAVTWSTELDGVGTTEGGNVSCPSGPSTNPETCVYTAPATPGSYSVVATSVEDPSVSTAVMVTVQAIAVTLAPPAITVGVGQTQPFTATVTGTMGTQSTAVTWSVSPAGVLAAPQCLTPTATQQTCDYTGSTPGTYLITATSVLAPSASVTATLTVGSSTTLVNALAAGGDDSCAVVNGGVWCWGNNYQGQIGTGSTGTPVLVPAQVPSGVISNVTAIAEGGTTTCALVGSPGTAWCWGYNGSGQLGNGNQLSEYSPTEVLTSAQAPLEDVTAIAVGSAFTCAVVNGGADGTAWCWGVNDLGQLGNNSSAAMSLVPVQVLLGPSPGTPLTGVSAIAAGQNSVCAVASGAAYCWGDNYQGQLGSGTPYSTPGVGIAGAVAAPVPASGITGIAVGEDFACAFVNDGPAWCWGDDTMGQLGDNPVPLPTQYSSTPVQVVSPPPGTGVLTGVTALAAGVATCAIVNGGVLCWGINSGSLGNNSLTNSPYPVQAAGLTVGVTAIAAGEGHGCAATSNARAPAVQCWGANADGQLGNNSETESLIPLPVASAF